MFNTNDHERTNERLWFSILTIVILINRLFTYIHNWSLQPSSQGYWSSFSVMLCVLILSISHGTYSLKSPPNDRFFEKLFMAIYIFSQSFCQKSAAERKSPKKYFSYFVSDVWPGTRTLVAQPTKGHDSPQDLLSAC